MPTIQGNAYSSNPAIAAAQEYFLSSIIGRDLIGMPYSLERLQDCSNFVRQAVNGTYALNFQGVTTQQAQTLKDAQQLTAINADTPIAWESLQIGDLVYMNLQEKDDVIVPSDPTEITRHVVTVAGINQDGQVLIAHATGRDDVEASIIEVLPESYIGQISHIAYGFLESREELVTNTAIINRLTNMGMIFHPEDLQGEKLALYESLEVRTSQTQLYTQTGVTFDAEQWLETQQASMVTLTAQPDAYFLPQHTQAPTDALDSMLTTVVFLARAWGQTVGHMIQNTQHAIADRTDTFVERLFGQGERGNGMAERVVLSQDGDTAPRL